MVGNQRGQSFSANDTWERRKSELNRETVNELENIPVQMSWETYRNFWRFRCGEVPVFAPERLEQAGGGPEPRIERLMDAMFLEDVGRDERQLVNGLSEFRGHASRSNDYEANSGDGGRNLQSSLL